jgi:imidazole glycerol-phosphate synthase subunit HisF
MLKIRVIPCLLLHNDGLVKTVKFRKPKYVGDPINAVKIFNDKFVDELIFLDIDASKQKRGPNFNFIADISTECFIPFCYGGGIRNIEDAEKLFSLGVEKISLNATALDRPEVITDLANHFGSQSIVGAMDIKKSLFGRHHVYKGYGRKKSSNEPVEYARELERLGAGEILVSSIDRDGTRSGYDVDIIRDIASSVSIPVIACGGAAQLSDISILKNETEVAAAAAGSIFVFKGKHDAVLINYPNYNELKKL